jgi:hypothetical protein
MRLVRPAKTDPANTRLEQYSRAIQAVAAKRGHHFADILNWNVGLLDPATDNGMHLTEVGYQMTAPVFLRSLGLTPTRLDWHQLEPLRQAVIAKNELFFHRWRPQNETYLFGFRKHEQGKNAKEVAEFDPLVAQAEERIDQLRQQLSK